MNVEEADPLLTTTSYASSGQSHFVFPPQGLIVQPNAVEDNDFNDLETRRALEKSLIQKLDRRMSMLILIYILNYIDRNNAAVARLRGLEDDLRLTGNQFASILGVLYFGYLLMQVPSNMHLHRIRRPSLYLSGCMVIWGLLSILTGLSTSFFNVLCARFFLGFVEAAFFPGALFLLSRWYKQNELSERMSLLFCGSLISNAFGTLLASAILDITDGLFGFAAWRWLFFVEGFVTVLIAIWAIFVLPDFPGTPSTWLTEAESSLARRRMIEDYQPNLQGDTSRRTEHSIKASENNGLWLAILDWKVWWLACAMLFMVVSLSFNAYFPTLSATMGYNATLTLLLCAPPWILCAATSLYWSRDSDRTGERFWHIVVPLLLGIVGFILGISTMNTAVRYFSFFLMAQSYAAYGIFLAWASVTVRRPASKQAVALALINMGASIGNMTGSYIWPSWWGPSYVYSYMVCIAASILAISMCRLIR